MIALYWKPVYRYIRFKFRKDNEDAKDLTQSFFATALERDFFARFDSAKASFRTYLRMAVDRFAASQHAAENRLKRGGEVEFEPIAEQAVASESPEQVFEREWQRQSFSLALDDLQAHCETCGKQLQFRIFEAYDLAEGERPSYASLAARYAIAETTVNNHLACAPHVALFRHRTASRRYLRRAGVAPGDAQSMDVSDSVLDHLRQVAALPDLTATRYEIEFEIGRGGMGVVYAARDRQLGRRVALKILDAALAGEARIIAQLEHPATKESTALSAFIGSSTVLGILTDLRATLAVAAFGL